MFGAKCWKAQGTKERLAEMSKEIRQGEELIEELRAGIVTTKTAIEDLKIHRAKLIKESKKEIMDYEAPRCGQPWNNVEQEHVKEQVEDLAYDLAKKYGRSTCALRFRFLKILIEDLIREDHIEGKIRDIMAQARML
jgi:hypothetical protein